MNLQIRVPHRWVSNLGPLRERRGVHSPLAKSAGIRAGENSIHGNINVCPLRTSVEINSAYSEQHRRSTGAAPESAKSRCICPSTGAAYLASGSAPGACAAVHKPLGAAGPQWRGAGGAHAIAKAHAACIHEGGFGPTWAEGGWRSCSHGVVAAAAAADG